MRDHGEVAHALDHIFVGRDQEGTVEPGTLIDAHTHTQPSPAAMRTYMARLGLEASREGTAEELLREMDQGGVAWSMIVGRMPAQVLVDRAVADGGDRDEIVAEVLQSRHELNAWAAATAAAHPDRFKAVAGLDPVLMSPAELEHEARTQLAAGAAGLKVAPMFLGVPADDEEVEIVWRLAVELDVPVLSECGALDFGELRAWGHPRYFHAVVRSYPSLHLQLAHLGVGAEDVTAAVVRLSERVLTDTAGRSGGGEDPAELAALIRQIGVDRVAFGTNYPIAEVLRRPRRGRAACLRRDGPPP